MKEADDLLRLMGQGILPKRADSAVAPVLIKKEEEGFQLQCDVNGCSIVPVSKSEAAPSLSGEHICHRAQRQDVLAM